MKWVVPVAMVLALPPPAPAQEPPGDPPALTALRQRYQALLPEAAAQARTRWLATLEQLEKQRVAAGDIEGAALVRERRLGVPGAHAGAPARVPVQLSPATARTTTGVDFTGGSKEIGRFRRAGSLMEWELPGQIPGTYEVQLIFGAMGDADGNDAPDPYKDPAVPIPSRSVPPASANEGGGIVEFRKITGLKEGGALLRSSVRPTGSWTKERTLTLGTVDLDSKIVKFSLRAVDAMPAGVMDFRRIDLVPAASAGTAPADAAGMREFARLRDLYQKQFTEQTRALTAKYIKSLGELEVLSSRNRDNDTLALVRQEKERMAQGHGTASAVPATSDPGHPAGRLLPVTEKLYMLVKGEARLTSQGDYLTRMRPANGCEVTWKLAGLGVTSGTYTVEVDCRLTPEHGGTAYLAATTPGGSPGPSLKLTVEAPSFPGGESSPKRKPDGTPGTSKTATFTAGTITIPKGSEFLKLIVTSLAVPDGGLCDLKSLRLTPVPAETP